MGLEVARGVGDLVCFRRSCLFCTFSERGVVSSSYVLFSEGGRE